MQDYSSTPGFIEAANPFEAASNLGKKRGAEDEAVQVQYSDAQHPVMPLPKRRIVSSLVSLVRALACLRLAA